ncbi:hypothetical protein TRIATDRAFT_84070 [Trichoderma atroviride IMI 206040]|uniref:Uncharacterized protein n=1 Tax=Hypocrea atroviridis (strain ATCC 20476 / IMI 206040) TaxID=452589 RepID=G9P5V4_HYPAI|nr:uncharacterized protein TRIATDRAFT_84070 [Trichoderma atroviride IMI 206040]EHK42179.1 hypothetical protein TRIATDRAFT_84070 [Trichoderma atroviride IMI 206040]
MYRPILLLRTATAATAATAAPLLLATYQPAHYLGLGLAVLGGTLDAFGTQARARCESHRAGPDAFYCSPAHLCRIRPPSSSIIGTVDVAAGAISLLAQLSGRKRPNPRLCCVHPDRLLHRLCRPSSTC